MSLTPEQRDEIRDAARQATERTRRQQGKPPYVEDPDVLDHVADIFRAVEPADSKQEDAA